MRNEYITQHVWCDRCSYRSLALTTKIKELLLASSFDFIASYHHSVFLDIGIAARSPAFPFVLWALKKSLNGCVLCYHNLQTKKCEGDSRRWLIWCLFSLAKSISHHQYTLLSSWRPQCIPVSQSCYHVPTIRDRSQNRMIDVCKHDSLSQNLLPNTCSDDKCTKAIQKTITEWAKHEWESPRQDLGDQKSHRMAF